MNFSIVLPSLGNKELLTKMLDSFERTTKHKKEIEFLIALDEGKLEEVNKWFRKDNYSYKIEFYERPYTEDFTNDYYNFLANRSSGNNVMAFNDDAWMRTQDWDVKILREIKAYGWSVYMLDIPDTARIKYKHTFPCFPMVSRRSINTLGWLLHKDIPMYPADSATHSVYYNAKRVIPIKNVLIEHEHILETDKSKARMMEIFRKNNNKSGISIGADILKLAVIAGTENNKINSKINRILNILME